MRFLCSTLYYVLPCTFTTNTICWGKNVDFFVSTEQSLCFKLMILNTGGVDKPSPLLTDPRLHNRRPPLYYYTSYSQISRTHRLLLEWRNAVRKYPHYILVAARFKAWVCGRSPAEIVGSNPTEGMDVCRRCCVLSGRGLPTSWPLVQRSSNDCGESLCVILKPRVWGAKHQSLVIELKNRRYITGCIFCMSLIVTVKHNCWMSPDRMLRPRR
jgi:hypothetical protein